MPEHDMPGLASEARPRQSVAVIGLGYVGLPLALLIAKKGYQVFGIDVDKRKIDTLKQKKSYLPDLHDDMIVEAVESGQFYAVSDMEKAGEAEAIIICVPTPLTSYHTPDLTYLQAAAQALGEQLKQDQLVVLESSTYPGTTKEVLQPILEKTSGLRVGKDFHIAYSPERIDPGNKSYTVEEIPKLVSGLTDACGDRIEDLYSQIFQRVVRVSSPEVAEMAKILENSQRLVNISFINEIAQICDQMNIDVWEVIDAAATKPFGFTPYYPGPGIGGHCIPVDPLYLQWKSRSYGTESQFIGLSEKVNRAMPHIVAGKISELLDGVPNPKVLLYGVAYKKDVNDVRESPALDLITILHEQGVKVDYHDPYIDEIRLTEGTMHSVELTVEKIQEADCVIILTDHTGIPVELIVKHAQRVFDTRNATTAVKDVAHVYRFGGGRTTSYKGASAR